jgi:hypothetical protein
VFPGAPGRRFARGGIVVTCAGMACYGVHGVAWWLTVDCGHVTMLKLFNRD